MSVQFQPVFCDTHAQQLIHNSESLQCRSRQLQLKCLGETKQVEELMERSKVLCARPFLSDYEREARRFGETEELDLEGATAETKQPG
jgi:hypothetical protein